MSEISDRAHLAVIHEEWQYLQRPWENDGGPYSIKDNQGLGLGIDMQGKDIRT